MTQQITDRELLERAAKAAGYEYAKHGGYIVVDGIPGNWNPLTDDGDALRLAAKLHIDLDWQATHVFPEPTVEAYQRNADGSGHCCASEPETDYRRAIVRAAAEIGRAALAQEQGGGDANRDR